MEKQRYLLKPNVIIEPLIGRWYAWAHLIAPGTLAMNIVGRHLMIMDSYIQSHEIHEAAVLNPKMKGGPFIDYLPERVSDIAALREETFDSQQNLFKLAEAFSELDRMLKSYAKGYSLEPLYEKVPNLLKGYVELVYDLNNNPSFRLYEHLLYKSEFYDKRHQSIALWITNNDERPFCLSTPRLDMPDVLHLEIPFDHPGIDLFSKMKRKHGSLLEIADVLGVKEEDMPLFSTFFTETDVPEYKRYDGDNVRMRYFGHACILIETKDISILVDPLISYYGYESYVDHYSDVDLPDVIDYVLITHNHQDHILFETLLPLRHKIKNIVVPRTMNGSLQDPNLKLLFNAIGFNNVIEVDEMEEVRFNDCTITGVPFMGEHSDLNIRAKLCFHVRVGQSSFMFIADSRVLEAKLYEHIQKVIGNVDVLFLGMECDGAPLSWLYGPLFTDDLPRDKDQSRRLSGCDFKRGKILVDTFKPKEVYVYAMGQEPWVEFISSIKYTPESNPIIQSNLLVKDCLERGIVAEKLFGEKELLYDIEPSVF